MYTYHEKTRDTLRVKSNRQPIKSNRNRNSHTRAGKAQFMTEQEFQQSQEIQIKTCFRTGREYRLHPCGKTEYI